MRILGKGKTALAIKKQFKDAKLYDDKDKDIFEVNSDILTIVSPGIPPYNYLVKNSKNLISEYDLFKDKMPFNIWISGTNGKTTTTKMLELVLKNQGGVVGGNIGTPLGELNPNKKIWILETSSFTLHYTKMTKPNIYLLLPVGDDHCSWHGSFGEYEKAKLKPLNIMETNNIAIIPSVYKEYSIVKKSKAKIYFYKNSKDLSNLFNIKIDNLKFKEPFLLDAVMVMSAITILKNKFDLIENIDYERLLNNFKQDKHKLEELRDNKNRLWIDDSKATNIDATIEALKGYKNKNIYLILGGDDKGADLIPLFDELLKYKIKIFTSRRASSFYRS